MDKQNSRYRWVVFAAVMVTYLLIVTQRTAPGLISDQIMKDFNVTASTIGLLTSIQFLAYVSLQIPIGILADRFGPNMFLIIGTLLNGVGTFIYSLAPNEVILLLARLLVGMGDATIWINLVLILSQWFKAKEFVSLIGFAGLSGSLGFVMASVPFAAWIALSGWRAPFSTVGVLLILCGILLYFVLIKKTKQLNLVSNLTIKKGQKRENTLIVLRRIISNRQAWAAFLCHFGVVGTYVGFAGSWAVPYGMFVYGMTRSEASQLMMIGIIGAIIGGPLSSWIANRLDSIKRPYVVFHMIVFFSWFTFLLYSGKPPFILLIILFLTIGLGNGSNPLTFAVVRQSFDIKEVGVASGFANTGGFLSAVLLPSIFGKVLDHFQTSSSVGFHYGFIIPVIFSMFGLIGGILIKEYKERPQEKKQPSELLV